MTVGINALRGTCFASGNRLMEKLASAIRDGIVLLDSDSIEMDDVLMEVVRQCVKADIVPTAVQEQVLETLRNREALDSTAIGHGVAIPHAYIEGVKRPAVVFVRLQNPLDVRAIDGEPARFLFILLGHTGQVDAHLEMLGSIALAMSDDEFRSGLLEASSEEDVVEVFSRFLREPSVAGAEEEQNEAHGLVYSGVLAGGLRGDVRRRLAHYRSDFTDGLNPKTLTATIFLYFACMAPAVLFGGLMHNQTGQQIGVPEMLIATAICGTVYSLCSGQPLIVLGGTGPLLVFTGILYQLCGTLQIPFLETYAWVGLWTAGFTILLAVTDSSVLIRHFTRFTDEIFAALISLIFIIEAVTNILRYVGGARSGELAYDVAFLSLLMAVGTFALAMMLAQFRRSRYLVPAAREFLADFGPTLALVLLIVFGGLFPDARPETLRVPAEFGPSMQRNWLIPLFRAPLWVWFAAAGPALLATVLVFLDQNISARLVNNPDHKLRKGAGYHLDLAVVGVLTALCSLTGLPWLVAATVRSLNHVRALATVDDKILANGDRRDEIIHVSETRLTGLFVHVLIGASLFLLPWLQSVPEAALYGLFLYMGVVSISGNQLFERVSLWLMDPKLYPGTHYIRKVPIAVINRFTLLQVTCLGVLWGVKVSVVGILFPLFIALLVPMRTLAGRWFDHEHLEALDAEQLPEEEESECL